MSNGFLIGFEAITQIHVGEGQSRGAVDLPVARDAFDIPFIPGSAHKGAIRAAFTGGTDAETRLFGPRTIEEDGDDQDMRAAGNILFGDLQLVALPVRSNLRPFVLVTAPTSLKRLAKLMTLSGIVPDWGEYLVIDHVLTQSVQTNLMLEDLRVASTVESDLPEKIARSMEPHFAQPAQDLAEALIIVQDAEFVWLCRNALPVRAHNRLTERKTVEQGALWYEETVPPGTLFASFWANRTPRPETDPDPCGALMATDTFGTPGRFLQIGGNETVGQGWFQLTLPENGGAS